MLLVIFAHRTNAVVAQKFVRIEHPPQQTFHAMAAGERDQAAFAQRRAPASAKPGWRDRDDSSDTIRAAT